MEFAHVVAAYGSQVTVLQRDQQILTGFDSDLVDQLCTYSKDQGIDIQTGVDVKRVRRNDDGSFSVSHQSGDGEHEVIADLVVHGAGRVPKVESLNLEKADVETSDGGICVDEFLRSRSNPGVFAAGDCAATGQPKLTPTANEEARVVAKNLFEDSPTVRPDYGSIPRVAFTTPSIAAVGMSEDDAKKRYSNVNVLQGDSSQWGSIRKSGIPCAGYKILLVDQQIVGAHLLGHAAEETINFFALAMKFDLSAKDLKSVLFTFPTFASDIRQML